MGIMTDRDIKKALGKDIVIAQYNPKSLTPIGYDFSIGDFVYSLENGLIESKDNIYYLPPKSTIQIITKESLWVSHRIAGTFHSKVSLVSMGLSHISTTLDPGWYGPLLITIRNNMDIEIKLKKTDTFVTLLFYKVDTPTKSPHNKPQFRQDILLRQLLDNQTISYINKVSTLIADPNILAEFKAKVYIANEPMVKKIISSRWRSFRSNILSIMFQILLYLLLIASFTTQFYWNHVNFMFNKIDYDSAFLAAQLGAVIAIIGILMVYYFRKK